MRIVARLLVLLPLLWVEGVWAVNCPDTNYDLRTQAQVDSFVATGCDTISGSLIIASDSYYRANLDLGGADKFDQCWWHAHGDKPGHYKSGWSGKPN